MAYELRKAVHSQRKRFGNQKLETSQENKLLGSIDSFMNGYYGIRKFLTTPGTSEKYVCFHSEILLC